MIDLTPLDVRKKAGDFRRILRGYDPEEVEGFLQLAAERLEELVKENLTLRERSERLQEQLSSYEGRERAVQEALVMAQQLRSDLKGQAEREAELRKKEVEAELQRRVAEAERLLDESHRGLEELERRRIRFLKSFRALLNRELEAVDVEESRTPLEETPVELELGARGRKPREERGRKPGPAGGAGTADGAGAASGDGEAGQGGLWLSSVLKDDDAGDEADEEPSR